jgi:small-conductance mechanosensitive channel
MESRWGLFVPRTILAVTSYWNGILDDLKLDGWRFAGAVVVVLVTLLAARIVSARVRHGLQKTRLGPNPILLISRLSRAAIYFIGVLWILGLFSIPFTALAAIFSVAALALSLSLQDLLKNLIAGVYILAERPFHIGDRITVSGVTGVIDDIEMRVTFLHTDDGERVIMPNQTVFTNVVVNNTVSGGRTCQLSIETPRTVTLEQVQTAVMEATKTLHGVAAMARPRLEPMGATADTIKWRLRLWLPEGSSTSDLIISLLDSLPAATIDATDS